MPLARHPQLPRRLNVPPIPHRFLYVQLRIHPCLPVEPRSRGAFLFEDGLMSIPSAYYPASWHCTTKVDPITQEIGLGLIRPDGEVIRARLNVSDAWNLAESLTEYLSAYDASQSAKSFGNPSEDGSPESGQKQ